MRDWYLHYVEEPLDRLPINWDTWFVGWWLFYAIGIVLSGGDSHN